MTFELSRGGRRLDRFGQSSSLVDYSVPQYLKNQPIGGRFSPHTKRIRDAAVVLAASSGLLFLSPSRSFFFFGVGNQNGTGSGTNPCVRFLQTHIFCFPCGALRLGFSSLQIHAVCYGVPPAVVLGPCSNIFKHLLPTWQEVFFSRGEGAGV